MFSDRGPSSNPLPDSPPTVPSTEDLRLADLTTPSGPSTAPFGKAPRGPIRDALSKTRHSRETVPITRDTNLYRYEVSIPDLKASLEGFTILHLSDIHFQAGSDKRLRAFKKLINHLENTGQQVDLVCLTGDIVTDSSDDLNASAVALLRRIGGNCPKIFVLGNHDYSGNNPDLIRECMNKAGYSEMCNKWSVIEYQKARVGIYGTDDFLEGSPCAPQSKIAPQCDFNLLLTHNLDALTADYPDCFSLALSGHLHGGEVNLGIIDGTTVMRMRGHSEDRNNQRIGWKALSENLLSYISPGQARHHANFGVRKPGATIMTLRSHRDPLL